MHQELINDLANMTRRQVLDYANRRLSGAGFDDLLKGFVDNPEGSGGDNFKEWLAIGQTLVTASRDRS